MIRTTEEFKEYINTHNYGLCPPPIEAQEALSVIKEHLLGKDFHVVMPLSTSQIYTVIVAEILMCYKAYDKKSKWKRIFDIVMGRDSE